jgi:hypothetical protein
LHGSLQFALTLAGHPSDPSASLRGSATGVRFTQAPLFGSSTLTLDGHYAQGTLSATATAATPLQAPIRISAALPVPLADIFSGKVAFGTLPLQSSLQASNLHLGPLLHLWSGLRKINGYASLDLKLKGPVQNPSWHGSLKADCPILHFASDRLPAVGGLTLEADFSEKELRLTRLKADLGGGATQRLVVAEQQRHRAVHEEGAFLDDLEGSEAPSVVLIAANDGKPVDIVFDPVGGEASEPAFRNLGYDGRHLVIGFTAGIAALRTNLPLLKSASLIGVQMRDHALRRPAEAEAMRRKVMELAGEGAFSPAIAERYPLKDYAAAMNAAFSGKAAGRVVLVME